MEKKERIAIIGAGFGGLSAAALLAKEGYKITIYEKGKFFRDLIYVSDVVSGINVILKKGKPGNLYWISSGKKTWFYDLAKSLRKSTDCKINFISSPTYTTVSYTHLTLPTKA